MVDVLHTIARQFFDRGETVVSVKKPAKIADDLTVPMKFAAPIDESLEVEEGLEADESYPLEDTSIETIYKKEDRAEQNTEEQNTKKQDTEEQDIEEQNIAEQDTAENMIYVRTWNDSMVEKEITENIGIDKSYEGNKDVEKEDYLLNQIDEFRAKAQILQNLLISKEKKVVELQNIVEEREGKARELAKIVAERKKRADGIAEELAEEMAKEVTTVLVSQIDEIIGSVVDKLDEFKAAVSMDLNAEQKLTEHQYIKIKDALDEVLPELNTQLDTLKIDLSEKIHSENVKCYRNISDLIKAVEDKMDILKSTEQRIEHKTKTQQKYAIALLALTAVNMAGIVVLLVLSAT